MRGRSQTHRRDANHGALRSLARQLGGIVADTSQCGHGIPDAYVWTRDKGWSAVEIKSGTNKKRPSQEHYPSLLWTSEADVCAHFGIRDE